MVKTLSKFLNKIRVTILVSKPNEYLDNTLPLQLFRLEKCFCGSFAKRFHAKAELFVASFCWEAHKRTAKPRGESGVLPLARQQNRKLYRLS